MARYSEPKATYWSVSAITAGLQAMGSRTTPKPLRVPTTKVKKPSRSVSVPPWLAQPGALLHLVAEERGRDLRVVLRLEAHAGAAQLPPHGVVVRQRPVVHEALVGSGGEGVRPGGGDGRFRRHAGVADAVGAGHVGDPEAGGHVLGQAHLLVDLDPSPALMSLRPGRGPAPRPRALQPVLVHLDHGVGVLDLHPDLAADSALQVAAPALEVGPGFADCTVSLAAPSFGRPIDGDPRAVRAPVRHGDEHVGQHLAQMRLELGSLRNSPPIPHMIPDLLCRPAQPASPRPGRQPT
jgi:hypothetical protein